MANKITICNMALAQLRAGPIESISEESTEAQQCDLFFDESMKFVLTDTQWNYLSKTISLTPINETPARWDYMFAYPASALYVKALLHTETMTEIEYDLMQGTSDKVIVANSDSVTAEYIEELDDITQLSAPLTQTMVYYLASQLAMSVVAGDEGRKLKQDNLAMYSNYLASARTHDVSQKASYVNHSSIFDSYE